MKEFASNGKGGDVDRLLLGIEDVQRALGIKRSMVFSLLQRGDLASTKIGRRRLVRVTALEAYVERLQTEQSNESHE